YSGDRESVVAVAAAVTATTMASTTVTAAAVAAAEPAAAEVAEVDPDAEPSAVVERIVEPGVVPVGGVAVVAIAIAVAVAGRDDDGGAGGGTAVVDVLAPVADVGLIQHGLDDRAGDLGVGKGDEVVGGDVEARVRLLDELDDRFFRHARLVHADH